MLKYPFIYSPIYP